MTIAPLKKVTLCGLAKDKPALLAGLQALGCMHLLPLRPAPAEVENVATPRAEGAYKALRFLSDAKEKRRQVVRDPNFDVENLVDDALDLKQRLRDASDRRDFLVQRIADITPWGDLSFPPLESLAGHRLWFYILPLKERGALMGIDLPWQIVYRDNRFLYVVLVAEEEPSSDLLPVARTRTGALPVATLKEQLNDIEIELEDLAAQRQALTRYIYLLSVNLAEAENRATLTYAEQQTRDDDAIVAVQGWVPMDAVSGVQDFAKQGNLACLVEDPGPRDEPPTLIEQPDEMEAGVDLAMFYQVPSYNSWDPSVLLLASFSVFFAMILADAGYGLLFMAGLLAFWQRLGQSKKGRAYRLLALSLFGCTIVYGVLVGSYFGVPTSEGSFLDTFHILSVDDFDTMMRLSIIIGVLHIVFANAMMIYINRWKPIALSKLGWIAGLFGGLFLWLGPPDSFWNSAGVVLLVGGLIAVFLFSSERPVAKPLDYLLRGLDGLQSLMGIMGAFGDVLSYMRLFALGLASASLAQTFNNLATGVHDALPGLGLLIAILILVIGHMLNIALSLMSGVVHGLRLNFMEFYKWGLPEEGKPFHRFARKEVQP